MHFLNFLKSDVSSTLHSQSLYETLKLSIDLLPPSKNLRRILSEYLMDGSYTQEWGVIVLKVALENDYLEPEELYKIASSINEYGLILEHLQHQNKSLSVPMLDYAYRAYGDRDLIYGYRIAAAYGSPMRMSLLSLQQRRYVETLTALDQYYEQRENSSTSDNDSNDPLKLK